MGAVAKINIHVNYQGNDDFNSTIVELPLSSAIALMFRIDIGYPILFLDISGYVKVDNPLDANISNFWIDEYANIFARSANLGQQLRTLTTISIPAPVKNGNTYSIQVPVGFTITTASFQGIAINVLQQLGQVVTISSPINLKIDDKETGDRREKRGVTPYENKQGFQ